MKLEKADRNKKVILPEIHRYKTPEYIENQTKETIFDN
jgi:type IV secretory pathway VirB4 component